ncbi:1-acyl-sn-glycerol-3-phosphate acyltransferase [Ruaniaceae bacterium KH17]|nr:1-acyl-sn-glycerol-3-phosphate acyltransferase [Ruaniaceae bacterium KH17]
MAERYGDDLRRWGPKWSRHVGMFLAKGYWNTTIIGRETFPTEGPVIVACNHIGVVDGPLLHGCLPRGSHILIKQEFFHSKLGILMDWAGQIPVDRSNGRTALTTAKQLLDEGRVVGIFPEGHRGDGKVHDVRAGVAWLEVNSGASIVFAATLGTRPEGASVGYVPPPRSKLQVILSEPYVMPEVPRGRAGIEQAIEYIGEGLRAHVEYATKLTGVELPGDEGTRK